MPARLPRTLLWRLRFESYLRRRKAAGTLPPLSWRLLSAALLHLLAGLALASVVGSCLGGCRSEGETRLVETPPPVLPAGRPKDPRPRLNYWNAAPNRWVDNDRDGTVTIPQSDLDWMVGVIDLEWAYIEALVRAGRWRK